MALSTVIIAVTALAIGGIVVYVGAVRNQPKWAAATVIATTAAWVLSGRLMS